MSKKPQRTSNISDVLNNIRERARFTFRINPDGNHEYIKGDVSFEVSKVESMYPVARVVKNIKGDSPDSRTIKH